MNERVLMIAIAFLLGLGFVGVSFMVVPWVFDHGFSDWKQTLRDDGLILFVIIFFVYSFYMSTKLH